MRELLRTHLAVRPARRTLLRATARGLAGLTGSTCAASALRFFERTAEAQSFPLRFLFVYTSSGRDTDSRCTGTGSGFTLGPGLRPLEMHKKKLLIVDGLRIPAHTGEEHPCGKASLLTGRPAANGSWFATGPSFDRYLANKIANGVSFYVGTTGHQTGPGDNDLPVSWNAAGVVNDAYTSGSDAVLRKLFNGAVPAPSPPTSPEGGSTAADRRQADIALYDYLMAEVERLRPRVAREHYDKLHVHLQALTQIQADLRAHPDEGGSTRTKVDLSASCTPPPPSGSPGNETDRVSLIVAHALACGRARIGVLRIGAEDPYHTYSHWHDGPDFRARMREMDLAWASHFANLLTYLDSFREGSGTLLDNTLVVWGSDCSGEFATGADFGGPAHAAEQDGNGIHGTRNMPFVLAGGLGGRFRTGERVLVPERSNVELYRTVAAAMGTNASDFGQPSLYTGPLTTLLR